MLCEVECVTPQTTFFFFFFTTSSLLSSSKWKRERDWHVRGKMTSCLVVIPNSIIHHCLQTQAVRLVNVSRFFPSFCMTGGYQYQLGSFSSLKSEFQLRGTGVSPSSFCNTFRRFLAVELQTPFSRLLYFDTHNSDPRFPIAKGGSCLLKLLNLYYFGVPFKYFHPHIYALATLILKLFDIILCKY